MGRRQRLLMKIRRGDILYADLGVQVQVGVFDRYN